MQATISNPSVPPGAYVAEFIDIEEIHHKEYGDGWRWEFQIVGGEFDGRQVYRTTKPTPTVKNSCGKFLAALARQRPAENLSVDTDKFRGRHYDVVLDFGQDGESTKVTTISLKKIESKVPAEDIKEEAASAVDDVIDNPIPY